MIITQIEEGGGVLNTVLKPGNIPGTVFSKEKMGGVTGGKFLDKVFYITDSIMLAQIREITGIDGSTLQNWLKSGMRGRLPVC